MPRGGGEPSAEAPGTTEEGYDQAQDHQAATDSADESRRSPDGEAAPGGVRGEGREEPSARPVIGSARAKVSGLEYTTRRPSKKRVG